MNSLEKNFRTAPNENQDLGVILNRLSASMQNKENNEEKIHLLEDARRVIELHGGTQEANFSEYIKKVAALDPDLIVRREDPVTLFHAIETNTDIPIRFREDAHGGAAYPNAGLLGQDASGLIIPYQRGFGKVGKGEIVTVIGFKPNLEKTHVIPLRPGEYTHYNDQVERDKIRMVEGTVDPKGLKFFILRFPRKFFPESEMTDEELENENLFHISRIFSFGNDRESKSDH